jgi:hypothetical protein
MKSLLLTMVLVMLSFSITLAAEPTIEEIKAGSDMTIRFAIPLEEGQAGNGTGNTKDKTWATAYGLLWTDDRVYFYVEPDEDDQSFKVASDISAINGGGDPSDNFLTESDDKNGQGVVKISNTDANYFFQQDGNYWTANVAYSRLSQTGSFRVGVAVNSNDGKTSGFGFGEFNLNLPESNIPIDGGLGFLLAAGLGFGIYKKRK